MGGRKHFGERDGRAAARFRRTWVMAALAVPSLVFGHPEDTRLQPDAEPIRPLPVTVPLDPDRVALGERLFNDPRLSRGERFSCASCHHLDSGGDDGRPRSLTRSGEPDPFNTPTVFNVGFNHRYGWRGEFDTLEAQIEAAIANPRHGDSTWPDVIARLKPDRSYRRAFRRLYPAQGLSAHAITDALAAFQKSLITPNAPFDHYLRGDEAALTERQKKGYLLFKRHGCVSCHQGVNAGGNLFQRLGIFEDYFDLRGREPAAADAGRFSITGRQEDLHVFRVPSLRNVALTAPYFHDGSARDLAEAVRIMGRVQLGRRLSEPEVCAIVDFLGSLTGEYRGRPLAPDRGPSAC